MSRAIEAKANLTPEAVAVNLALGEATLALTYKRDSDQAIDDMVALVENAEGAISEVLEALAEAAEAQEAADA